VLREEPLSLPQKCLKVVSQLVAPGAVGVALLLGSVASVSASQDPAGQQPARAQDERVSERLAAIRDAVSTMSGAEAEATKRSGERHLAWHNGWGNWGLGGLGLRFGPWGNGWNDWNNWHNWHNGWPNFWHNY